MLSKDHTLKQVIQHVLSNEDKFNETFKLISWKKKLSRTCMFELEIFVFFDEKNHLLL